MRRYIAAIGMLCATGSVLTSCTKECSCLSPEIKAVNKVVKVVYDTSGGSYNFRLDSIAVQVKNQLNGTNLFKYTHAAGISRFDSIGAGLYNVEANITISRATYELVTGLPLNPESVTFNAALNNIILNNASPDTIRLTLQLGTIGDWVLKQVYYAGSNITTGAVQRDQFIEVYNNSNDTLYADSLYISQAFGSNTVSPNYSTGFYVNDGGPLQGQYDWSKSIGMPAGIGATTNYWYAKTIFRVPGNGKTYPILPGNSFVIASTAINHKAPYISTTGTTINILDPSLTVDLSGAEFEVYLGATISNPLNTDVDNPAVPNMAIVERGNNRDLVLDNPGREAILLFKTPVNITATTGGYPRYPDPTVTAITASTTLYYQIPNSVVIDAVQIQNPVAANRVPRRLTAVLDAGVTNVPAGQYSSQSIIRKTARTVGSRRVLMDNNNSTADFDYLDRALPKAFK